MSFSNLRSTRRGNEDGEGLTIGLGGVRENPDLSGVLRLMWQQLQVHRGEQRSLESPL